jgi:hypothetical protein
MKNWAVCVVAAHFAAAMPPPARAQTVVDGSGAEIPPDLLKKALASVAEQFSDPLATQFRRLHLDDERGVGVCGQVNAKNAFGGYGGFVVFNFNQATNTAVFYDLRGSSGLENKTWSTTAGCGKAAGLAPDDIRRIKDSFMKGGKP